MTIIVDPTIKTVKSVLVFVPKMSVGFGRFSKTKTGTKPNRTEPEPEPNRKRTETLIGRFLSRLLGETSQKQQLFEGLGVHRLGSFDDLVIFRCHVAYLP